MQPLFQEILNVEIGVGVDDVKFGVDNPYECREMLLYLYHEEKIYLQVKTPFVSSKKIIVDVARKYISVCS